MTIKWAREASSYERKHVKQRVERVPVIRRAPKCVSRAVRRCGKEHIDGRAQSVEESRARWEMRRGEEVIPEDLHRGQRSMQCTKLSRTMGRG
eukprot:1153539-Pleurochrysis_carterae.AAC.2